MQLKEVNQNTIDKALKLKKNAWGITQIHFLNKVIRDLKYIILLRESQDKVNLVEMIESVRELLNEKLIQLEKLDCKNPPIYEASRDLIRSIHSDLVLESYKNIEPKDLFKAAREKTQYNMLTDKSLVEPLVKLAVQQGMRELESEEEVTEEVKKIEHIEFRWNSNSPASLKGPAKAKQTLIVCPTLFQHSWGFLKRVIRHELHHVKQKWDANYNEKYNHNHNFTTTPDTNMALSEYEATLIEYQYGFKQGNKDKLEFFLQDHVCIFFSLGKLISWYEKMSSQDRSKMEESFFNAIDQAEAFRNALKNYQIKLDGGETRTGWQMRSDSLRNSIPAKIPFLEKYGILLAEHIPAK